MVVVRGGGVCEVVGAIILISPTDTLRPRKVQSCGQGHAAGSRPGCESVVPVRWPLPGLGVGWGLRPLSGRGLAGGPLGRASGPLLPAPSRVQRRGWEAGRGTPAPASPPLARPDALGACRQGPENGAAINSVRAVNQPGGGWNVDGSGKDFPAGLEPDSIFGALGSKGSPPPPFPPPRHPVVLSASSPSSRAFGPVPDACPCVPASAPRAAAGWGAAGPVCLAPRNPGPGGGGPAPAPSPRGGEAGQCPALSALGFCGSKRCPCVCRWPLLSPAQGPAAAACFPRVLAGPGRKPPGAGRPRRAGHPPALQAGGHPACDQQGAADARPGRRGEGVPGLTWPWRLRESRAAVCGEARSKAVCSRMHQRTSALA
nr:translation initiation factor IF-2-like [Oryctolagus cuniculus]